MISSLEFRGKVGPRAWDEFVERQPDGWFFHLSTWIDYATAYSQGAMDVSLAKVERGSIVGVSPMVVGLDGRETYGGQSLPFPLGASQALGSPERHGRPSPVEAGPIQTHVVDLTQPMPVLWRRLRGSYKPLINRANRELRIRTVGSVLNPAHDLIHTETTLSAALAIHMVAAGRQTRPVRTWMLQAEWLATGKAVMTMASLDGSCVGFAYAVSWKGWAYYFSSASLSGDILHALVWALMGALKAAGCRHMELGHAARPDSTSKEKGISFFKSGFGGDLWSVEVR